MTLMGGLGTLAGPILGAFGLTIGLECLRGLGEYRFMVYGVLLVIFILFMPRGLIHQIVPDDEEV
jgi:branched-chain amino acid transport system permease protein